MQANALDEEDDDDWVKEQIRKGVSSMAALNQPPLPSSAYPSQPSMAAMPMQSTQASAEAIALQGRNALAKLQQDLQRLQVSISQNL